MKAGLSSGSGTDRRESSSLSRPGSAVHTGCGSRAGIQVTAGGRASGPGIKLRPCSVGVGSRTLLFAGIADGKQVMFWLWMELELIHLLPDRSLEVLKSLLLEGLWSQLIQFSTAQCQQPAEDCRCVKCCSLIEVNYF